LARTRPGGRRPRRGGLHSARLSHRLPDADSLSASGAGATILVVGASGTVGTALLDLARHFGFGAIGTCSAANLAAVQRFGATAIDYRAGDFVAAVRRLTSGRGVDAAFDAIGGAHFDRSFACLAKGGLLVGYGSQTMAVGGESLISAGLGLARLKLWGALSFLVRDRSAVWYSITARRKTHPEEFKTDMAILFGLLRDGAIHPVVVERLPLASAREVHVRIDAGARRQDRVAALGGVSGGAKSK
jgi:NADPH:quinone reductase-like Zn-dependent oxidoreductase